MDKKQRGTLEDRVKNFEAAYTPREKRLRKVLLPAENLRRIAPRCCGTCAYGLIIDGGFECFRSGGYAGDVGDAEYWFHICDGYRLSPNDGHFVETFVDQQYSAKKDEE